MTVFTWHADPVPAETMIKQVYGFCFDNDGRVLMLLDNSKYSLPGGHPESIDRQLAETLRRECLEEVTVSITDPRYLGYQAVDDGDGKVAYAQVRMIARIKKILPVKADPDTGRIYKRLLTSAMKAGQLLNWGDLGSVQAMEAARAAKKEWGIPTLMPTSDVFV